jgi:hypothetical protein
MEPVRERETLLGLKLQKKAEQRLEQQEFVGRKAESFR